MNCNYPSSTRTVSPQDLQFYAPEIPDRPVGFAAWKGEKRAFDILTAVVALTVFGLPMLLIAALIKLKDGGTVIFKQERIGYKGRPFMLYKFRSMIQNAEPNGNPALCEKDDPRLTPVGRFLRLHHLDELPQLWNVLRGDMSMVGYRPERQFFIDQILSITPSYKELYRMRPGVFSNATLYNGYTDSMEKMLRRLRMDLEYLAHGNFFTDLRIIWNTATSILIGKKF